VTLHDPDTVHSEVDPADVVEPENPQSQVPKRSTREGDQPLRMTI